MGRGSHSLNVESLRQGQKRRPFHPPSPRSFYRVLLCRTMENEIPIPRKQAGTLKVTESPQLHYQKHRIAHYYSEFLWGNKLRGAGRGQVYWFWHHFPGLKSYT